MASTTTTTEESTGLEPDDRLARIETRIESMQSLLAELVSTRQTKDWYTTAEFGRLIERDEWTVREHCRHGRIKAEKRRSGRGPHAMWVISHAERLRYEREGLLPDVSRRLA